MKLAFLPCCFRAVITEPLAFFPSSFVSGFVARRMASVAAYLEDYQTPGHRPSFLGFTLSVRRKCFDITLNAI